MSASLASSATPGVVTDLRQLARAGGLLWQWASRTLQARYQQSILGWLWAFVQPAAQAAVFTFVFTRLVPVDTGGVPYAPFAYVATVAWAFLTASLVDMTNSIVDNMNLVNKIYFPREILPLAYLCARLVDFAVAGALFVVIAVYFRIPFVSPSLLLLPVVVIVQLLLVVGLGLAAAAMNVFVRDVRSLLLLATQLWMYASPVIYPLEAVPEAYRAIYSLNPMVGIIEAYRDVLLKGQPPGPTLLTSALIAACTCFVGYRFLKRVEFRFADIV